MPEEEGQPGLAAPCVSVVTLSGETILDVPLDFPGGVRAAVVRHFENLVDFILVYPEPLAAQLIVRRRIGIHQLLVGLRAMPGPRNSDRLIFRMKDDVDDFLGKTLQELYDLCAGDSGYIEMARVVAIWEQLQRLAPTRPLRMVDIAEISARCETVDRHSALRTLIGLHNEGQLRLPPQRFRRPCREVGMTLRVARR